MDSSRTRRFRTHAARLTCVVPFVVLCLAVTGGAAWQAFPQARRKAQAPPRKPAINFREPQRQYEQVNLGEWTVFVESQLASEAPDVANRALARLREKRAQALSSLPPHARAQLARIPFFVMYGPKAWGGGQGNGMEYFQKDAPEHHPLLDPRWKDVIVVYCAPNYLRVSELWALKAMFHEFAHAYHLENWPPKHPDIVKAFEHARDTGLYQNVLDLETREIRPKAYALTNHLEYFAEVSCMYFIRCNYQPSNRRELRAYDPVAYTMLRKIWKIGQ
jgi:hypothetical protein